MAKNKSILFVFGQRLRALRLQKGLTHDQFQELTGISPGALDQYEDGKLEPGLSTLKLIANALDISLMELLDFDYDH